MTNSVTTNRSFFADVRQILTEARRQAYSAVNFVMVEAYWKVGRRIVEEEQAGNERAEYGTFLIRELARQLGDEFGKGFSVANLKNFRQFYLAFPDGLKGYALRSQLAWTHIRLIMRLENPAARAYYIRETAEQCWSSRQLERCIKTLVPTSNRSRIIPFCFTTETQRTRRFHTLCALCVSVVESTKVLKRSLAQRHEGTKKNFNAEITEGRKVAECQNSASSVFSPLRAFVPSCDQKRTANNCCQAKKNCETNSSGGKCCDLIRTERLSACTSRSVNRFAARRFFVERTTDNNFGKGLCS